MRIAHNPDTGEYIGEVNGKWEKLQVAKNNAGDMMYFDTGSGKWSPFNGVAGATQKVETPDNSKLSWLDVPGEMARNLWPSAKRIATEMGEAILSPKETAKTFANTVSGLASKAGITDLFAPDDIKRSAKENEKYVDAITKYVKDSYGNPDAIKEKLSKDPAGAFSDALLLTTGIGGALKGGSKLASLAKAGNVAKTLGEGADMYLNASRVADPLYAVNKGLGYLLDKGFGKGMTAAQRAMLGIIKPSTATMSLDDRIAMAQAALDNKIPVTTAGRNKAAQLVNDYNTKIDEGIAAADAGGRTIDPYYDIAFNANDSPTRKEILSLNTPDAKLKEFDNALLEYLDYHGNDTSVAANQASKKATYKEHEKKYQANAQDLYSGKAEAAMELARQQRKAIEKAVPEVAALNKKEGAMIDLRDSIERALNRTANHNSVLNMRSLLTSAMMGGATQNPWWGLGAGAVTNAFSTPGMASRGAFMLEDMARKGQLPWLRNLMHTLYAGGQNNSIQNWFNQLYGNNQ